jgi:hypothetical protein
MKKILLFASAILCANMLVYGQDKQNVAVYVSGKDSSGVKKVITAKLVAALSKDNDYTATDRTAAFLVELRKTPQASVPDDSRFAKIGKQFGANMVCAAELTEVLGSAFLTARMIDVDAGTVVATAEKDAKMKSISDLEFVANHIAAELLKNIFTGDCRKKDQPVNEFFGCCEGLENINGICRDMTGTAYWIPKTACGVEVMAKDKDAEVLWSKAQNLCPYGWRLPAVDEINCLIAQPEFKATLQSGRGIWTSTTEVRHNRKYADYYSVPEGGILHVQVSEYKNSSWVNEEWNKEHVRCVRK